jgi:hypothetical protein
VRPLVLALALVAPWLGCSRTGDGEPTGGAGGTAGAGSSCPSGSESCDCYGNGTCDQGLTCSNGRCKPAASGGAGGMPSTGGAGGGGGTVSAGAAGQGTGGSGAGGGSSCLAAGEFCDGMEGNCCPGTHALRDRAGTVCLCMPMCETDAECVSGCCAPTPDRAATICTLPDMCMCGGEGDPCASQGDCCVGSACTWDLYVLGAEACSPLCSANADCATGCCVPTDAVVHVCAHPSYCSGLSCMQVGSRPCGLGTPCCPGSACIADAINQVCLPLCTHDFDCSTGCCAAPNGDGVRVCTDPGYCGR